MIEKLLEQYSEAMSSDPVDYLQELDRKTHLTCMQPHMLSGKLQGRLLSMISRMIRPEFIIEIGTYTGYSALCLAEGLTPNGRLLTIEIDEEKETIIQSFIDKSSFATQIELRIGNALDILPSLQAHANLIFIDADKLNYKNYYELAINLLAPNGWLIIDNTLFHGEVLDPQSKNAKAIHEVNEYIAHDDRVEQVLLPLRDGLTLITRKSVQSNKIE